MKELHNHIFSNTTCISKETMLRYINKQLSKKELYEVEKHMLDCELCTDAFEGMRLAKNSSMLFAIDSQIDQRVGTGNSKAPVMKNLMVAASILVIVFGAYFTVEFFNNTIDNKAGLAINDAEKLVQEESFEKVENFKNMESESQRDISNGESLSNELVDKDKLDEEDRYKTSINTINPENIEQIIAQDNISSYDMEEVEEELTVPGKIVSKERMDNVKGEKLKYFEDEEPTRNNRREDDFSVVLETESNNTNSVIDQVSNNGPQTDKPGESLKKEGKIAKNKSRDKADKKGKFKSNSQAPVFAESVPIEEAKELDDRNQQKILVIETYKVVSYLDEYQSEYDLKNANTVTTKSVSAGFESQDDKDLAEKEIDEIIVEVTYKETLEKAMKLYKDKKYTLALNEFDVILKAHPDEVNGLFYSGLSYYHLKQYTASKTKLNLVLKNKETEFNEEAKWYKASVLLGLKQTESAKKLLKEIIKSNGFYKKKAEEKLKKL